MPKKLILDVDPGFVDAMVLALALFDPDADVLALTSTGGNVAPHLAARNLQAILEFLDPPKLPRIGIGTEPDDGLPCDARHVNGIDGLCGTALPVAELRTQHPAEKVICDAVRTAPGEVTFVALGPLTNLARAFQRDPELPRLLHRVYICGGAVEQPGNITAAAEFNIYSDPGAAKAVLHSGSANVMVPLDATNPISFTLGMMEELPSPETKLGSFLRKILLPGFRAYRQCYGLEGIHLHDLVAYVCAVRPHLAGTQEMAVDVETEGVFCKGMTVFDRRRIPQWARNVEVARDIDVQSVLNAVIYGLKHSADEIETRREGD